MVLAATILLGRGSEPPVQSPNEVLERLVHVLPTFTALAKLAMYDLSEFSATVQDKDARARRDFYHNLYGKLYTLEGVLRIHDPDPFSTAADSQKALLAVLDELEKVFLSWTNGTDRIRLLLKLERQTNDRHPKLKALQTILLDDEREVTNQTLDSLSRIIRFYHKKSKYRDKELAALDQAIASLVSMQPRGQSESICPLRFSDYPVKHIREHSNILIAVLRERWNCTCGSPFHERRALKLNLTRHQRFETEPLGGQVMKRDNALFRVIFPTGMGALRWQETDITVKNRNDTCEEIIHNLCRIIEQTSEKTLATMAIYNKQLWQLQSTYGGKSSDKVADGEFRSLEELLQPSVRNGDSVMSKIDMKERVILSFILATSFFHSFNIKSSWLSITSADVCFRSRSTQHLNIVQPYLNVMMTEMGGAQLVSALREIHWYPNILTLGIMLLDIHQGSKLFVEPGKDRCAEVLSVYNEWEKRNIGPSSLIPDGCFQAMRSCIDPEQLYKGGLTHKDVRDVDVRGYIFEKIVYPLGDAISSIYEVSLARLHDTISGSSKAASCQEPGNDKQRAGQQWVNYLKDAQDVLFHYRFDNLDPKSATVKIAVLDTGLQLPEKLQQNYIQIGYLAAAECTNFCSQKHDETPWNHDEDGHGTHVGQIIHDVAPNAEIYVAKICKSRDDFESQKLAAEVQRNVANAIRHASEVWGVDMIVMSFGFESPVDAIGTAMTDALKLDKPPLFFAATSNNGAHKPMAWPAADSRVFGISSTDGDGAPSSFNPDEEDFHPILYAFGEGIKVHRPVGKPQKWKQSGKGEQPEQTEQPIYVSGTSFATPIAAGLAAILLGFVRVAVLACSGEDRVKYAKVPLDLQKMDGMLKVLQRQMRRQHLSGEIKSLLPWGFLKMSDVANNAILSKVYDTLHTT